MSDATGPVAVSGGAHASTRKRRSLTVNGRVIEVETGPGETLLDVLRERLGIRSLKRGCPPQGQCGACAAIVDGRPHATCTIAAESLEGTSVTTLEGVPEADREGLARAFAASHGVQCGFCIPGIALRAWHLVGRSPAAARREIAKELDEHLCRCTGYVKILDAIERFARERGARVAPSPAPVGPFAAGESGAVPPVAAGPVASPRETAGKTSPGTGAAQAGGVGASPERYQARELVLGTRPFVDDLERPGMLFGAVTLAAHARARVTGIDTAKARALSGVVAVATAADVCGERWQGLLQNDWPAFVAVGEEVRCVGDVLAAVAAVDERTARAAAELVDVAYEPLSPVLDPEEALADHAPRVHPHSESNVLSRSAIRRGDADAALRDSAHVVTGTWKTQRIEHLFLEPESALAVPLADGRMELHTQGQGIFDDRRQVAALLGIPEDRVFVELHPSGGAFGGKEDLTIQAHAALLAWMTRRPVKLTLSRRESIRVHPKRHPITIQLTAGCDADGRLTAVRARLVGDTGPYASVGAKVLERAAGHACGPYRVAHVDVEALAVRTNNPPCGAMRGFGVPQAAFALEGALDLLARRAGVDRWEIRWRNAVRAGDPLTTGQALEKSVGIQDTLLAVRDRYVQAKQAGRAVGIACGLKNCGLGNGVLEWGKARLRVEPDGTVSLYNGYTEMGQGLLTTFSQIACEVSGLPLAVFRPKVDATFALGCGQTTGSRATLIGGRAVESAARRLRAELDRGRTLQDLGGRTFAGDVSIDDTTPLGGAGERNKTHTTYGFATQLCILDENGAVERIVAAHDVGRAIHPAHCEGQIEGAVHMGLGYALTEELPCADGMPVTHSLYQLGALRASHMPEVEVILVEAPEPEGPFGAKGVGEIGLVPTAAAVASALEDRDGVRRTTLPMKDSAAARRWSVGKIRTPVPRERWR